MDKLMDRMVRSLKKLHLSINLSINYGQNLQTTYCLKWY